MSCPRAADPVSLQRDKAPPAVQRLPLTYITQRQSHARHLLHVSSSSMAQKAVVELVPASTGLQSACPMQKKPVLHQHQQICLLYGIQVYLITELVTGGELLEAVLQRGSYSESEARLAFVQLLKGIQYLHSK